MLVRTIGRLKTMRADFVVDCRDKTALQVHFLLNTLERGTLTTKDQEYLDTVMEKHKHYSVDHFVTAWMKAVRGDLNALYPTKINFREVDIGDIVMQERMTFGFGLANSYVDPTRTVIGDTSV